MFEDSKELCGDVEQYCKNKDEEIIKLSKVLGSYKVELDNARLEICRLKDDNYDLKKFYNKESIEKLQNDYLNVVAKLKSTEEILETHRATYKELNQSLSDKAKQVDVYSSKIKELENERDNYKADMELYKKSYEYVLNGENYLKNKIKELELINSEQTKIIECYKSQVEDLQKQVEVMEKVKKDRDDLAFKLTNRVAEVVNLKNKIENLTKERDDAELKVSLLRGAEDQLNNNASSYNQVKTENGVLRSKVLEYVNEIKDLKLKLSSATAYENERKSEVEFLSNQFNEVKQLNVKLKRKNRKLKNALNKSIEDFANYISNQKVSNNE